MRLGDLDALKEKLSGEDYQTWTHEYGYAILTEWVMNAIDNAPTVDIQTAVMELYKRYQPRLATNVYEFGVELEELLGRYAERR